MALPGVNFQPGTRTATPAGAPQNPNGVQEAIKILSLRLPRVVGARALSPQALLESPGAGGSRVDSVVNQVLAKYFPGAAPPSAAQSFGMMPAFDPNQGAEQPTFTPDSPYSNPFGRDRVVDRFIYTKPPDYPVPRIVSGGRAEPSGSPFDGQGPSADPQPSPFAPQPSAPSSSDDIMGWHNQYSI